MLSQYTLLQDEAEFCSSGWSLVYVMFWAENRCAVGGVKCDDGERVLYGALCWLMFQSGRKKGILAGLKLAALNLLATVKGFPLV